MTLKHTLISLLMIIATAFMSWTTLLSLRPKIATIVPPDWVPDAVMEDVTAVIMDTMGKPKMKIVTPKLVHFAEDDSSNLTNPQITLYRQSPQPWFITAKYARTTQGIENVNFWDNVVIHHPSDESNPTTLIQTLTLQVHPNLQTAETKDPITLNQPNLVVKATGMFADMNTGNIKLLSAARGEYVPKS